MSPRSLARETSSPAETPRLTARQQQILDWIRGHMEATGMPPTRAEIAAGLGFSTASSAEDHLQALARKGAIELTPGAARGLRLRDLPGIPIQGSLPLVGRVAAGSPILAAEHIEAQYRIDASLFTPRADYLLRVKGASMQDAGILDGDLLVVHKTDDARSGQIVVARLGEEVTVKRLKRRGREITLVAENADVRAHRRRSREDVVRDRGRRGRRDPSEPLALSFAHGHHPLPRPRRRRRARLLREPARLHAHAALGTAVRDGEPRRSHAVAVGAGHVGRAAHARRRAAGTGRLEPPRARGVRLRWTVAALRASGVRMRSDVVTGPGGSQILIEDPSGNPVELFEPRKESPHSA